MAGNEGVKIFIVTVIWTISATAKHLWGCGVAGQQDKKP